MSAAVLGLVGQRVALDLLVDPDQKAAWHAGAQKLVRSVYREDSCGKEGQGFQPHHLQSSPLLNTAMWIKPVTTQATLSSHWAFQEQ